MLGAGGGGGGKHGMDSRAAQRSAAVPFCLEPSVRLRCCNAFIFHLLYMLL